MSCMTGGNAIVQSLRLNGIDTLFCIPGVELDQFFVALYDERASFKVIANRHEQGCGYMAYGYAKSTGRIGAYAVVPGPGFLNSSAALSTAYAANAPVLCITGEVPSQQIGRGAGAHHEINDQLGIMRCLTKYAARIEDPALTPEIMETAFRELNSGRRKPVAIEMSPDIMAKKAIVNLREAASPPPPPAPDPELIEKAAALLSESHRPLIAVGGGIWGAEELLLHVAEMLQAPVSMSRNAKGAVTSRHYLGLPESAGHHLWPDADVILAIGTRLYEPYHHWGIGKEVKVIRIDIDPVELERNFKPAVAILADSKLALTALANSLEVRNNKRESRKDECEQLKTHLQKEYDKLSPQVDYIKVMREELPDDGFFVGEATQLVFAARVAMPFYLPRTFVTPGYQGTLGYGFSTALGVQVANTGKNVLSVNGDGGFLFGASELATAVQYRIPTVNLIFNDSAYGNVKRAQMDKYGGKVIASDLRNPDFIKLAEAYGAQALRADSPETLRIAIRRGFACTGGPTVIEIPVGTMPSPWHLIDMPKTERAKQ